MAVLAVGPRTRRWLSDAYPSAVVRPPDRHARGGVVEHLRFEPRHDLRALPGLGTRYPSRVRDSVALALAAGASSVDLLLARVPGGRPHHLDQPELLSVFRAPLERLPGTLVVAPDLAGPIPVLHGQRPDPEQQADRLVRFTRALAPVWIDAWQVALLDCDATVATPELMPRIVGADASLWAWSGSPEALARQGWRSAASAMAGLLSRRDDIAFHGKVDRTIALGAGRSIRRLQGLPAAQPVPFERNLNTLKLDVSGDTARVLGEATVRPPVGYWDIAALRTVKLIHQRIRLAADEFVFRPVTSAESLALTAAMDIVLRPFVQAGLLAGPSGVGTPTIRGSADRDPNQPSLVAEVGATVRPWARQLRVRVGVDPGVAASVEVQA